jgi:hypothetical protein
MSCCVSQATVNGRPEKGSLARGARPNGSGSRTCVDARELIRDRSTSLVDQVASFPSIWTTFSESIHG